MPISFDDRVISTLCSTSKLYKQNYVDYTYLIVSKSFSNEPYYIIEMHDDNFLHLSGVQTSLNASVFFGKCIDDSLSITDIIAPSIGSKYYKGTIRRKINVLPDFVNGFDTSYSVQENFNKNSITCNFASANYNLTIGFLKVHESVPFTLLKGNCLDNSLAKPIDVLLRKPRTDGIFNEVIIGNSIIIKEFITLIPALKSIVSKDLY